MNRAVVLGAVGLAGLYLWSKSSSTAQAVDPRWLAQQEYARRRAGGAAAPATDTLGMVLKLGGSALAIGGTAYKILSKVFSVGSEAEAATALTKYINEGPTSLTNGVTEAMSVNEMTATWQATPPVTPGTPVTPSTASDVITMLPGETITPVDITTLAPGEPPITLTAEIPTVEPMIVPSPAPTPPTDLGLPPVFDGAMADVPLSLTLPGSVFEPSAFEGATAAVLLQQDGLVKLSLTTEEFTQASNIVHLWESGQLDLSLLPADKAAFLSDNLPTLKAFTESKDFALGQFSSPVSGDTIMRVMPADVPTGLITEPGAAAPGMLQELLATPLWESTVEVGAAGTAVEAGAGAGITTLGDVLSIVGPVVTVVVACVSMYFTITGNLPDYQKAIYCALDVASIAALFIPVVGWIVAAVIQIVKFVLQKVLGQSLSHEQREAKETAYLLTWGASELAKELQSVMTLSRLYAVLTAWGSGTTGGSRAIAIITDVDVNGLRKIIGLENPTYATATVSEFVSRLDTLSVRIQGGVRPDLLEGANASLTGLIQALVPIMDSARKGDFDSTTWLLQRALALYMPATNPQTRYAPGLMRMKQMFPEYPWWNEVVLQTAYTLQANVWHFTNWLEMVNVSISQIIGPTEIERWGPAQLAAFSKTYGFTDFRLWRDAFFAFQEPVSRALLAGPMGASKLGEIQTQLELIVRAKLLNITTPIRSAADMQAVIDAYTSAQLAAIPPAIDPASIISL